MSDPTYQRTKRVNGQMVVRPTYLHGVMVLPGHRMYDPRNDGWRRLTKGRDGKLYENARNRPCVCGSGKRLKRCINTPTHNARLLAQSAKAVAS